ncbi:hypothetical protein [Pseudomonas chlororaphis]|uniref:hypothetical protein n=1 Tax=Pseudomonas chlororaphis TaxID=587753 RepID=UPI001476021E|nr:hypothetical protein [Pseudomonas chlororaphis]NNB43245.1 hypothetical protein [Pseudomonas chlororaphis]
MTWQKIRMSSKGFIVTLWLTAERFIAAFSRSGTSFHLENHIAWFYDGCAADRRLRQRLHRDRDACVAAAANGNAVAAKPESAICLENHITWFYDGCAADRSLRQRLQGPRCLCSRCRACEAANGNAVAAKPESAICLENHIAWFYDGYAADRRLRQRLQGPRCPRGKKMPAQWRAFIRISGSATFTWQ